jgi:hypothetical protein
MLLEGIVEDISVFRMAWRGEDRNSQGIEG